MEQLLTPPPLDCGEQFETAEHALSDGLQRMTGVRQKSRQLKNDLSKTRDYL